MGQPPNRSDRGDEEDLFEDLDQFFAPIESSDWTDQEEGPVGRPEADQPPAPQETQEALEDLESLSIDLPDERELIAADEGAAPEAAPPTPDEAEAPPSGDDLLEFFRGEDRGAEAPPTASRPEGPEWVGEATAEMEGDDWDALRSASAAPAAPPPEGRPEDRPPLSVDDLRTAPPEYSALPGPADEQGPPPPREPPPVPEAGPTPEAPPEEPQPLLEEEATIGPVEDLGADAPVVQPPPQTYPTSPIEVPPGEPPPQQAAPPPPGPPEPQSVEAAAEHFATGMRRSPDDVERELLSDLEQRGGHTVEIDPGQPGDAAPSWQEAAAQPVEPEAPEEAPRPPGGRNIPAAFVSGVILAIAVIALLAIGPGPFAVLAVAVILLGQAELYAVMRARGHRPATLLGLVAGGLMLSGAYLRGEGAVLLGLFIAMAVTVLWYLAAPASRRKEIVAGAGSTLLGVVYVPFMASFALMLLRPSQGRTIFLVVVGLTVLYDVVAFALGSWFGNRPLAPTVSPGKSWEGVWGATAAVLLVGLAAVPGFDPFDTASAVGLALVVAVFAPIGDLVESAFKRDLGVKDMSGLLPGHGGILDRVDAILFTAPAAFYFLRMFLPGAFL